MAITRAYALVGTLLTGTAVATGGGILAYNSSSTEEHKVLSADERVSPESDSGDHSEKSQELTETEIILSEKGVEELEPKLKDFQEINDPEQDLLQLSEEDMDYGELEDDISENAETLWEYIAVEKGESSKICDRWIKEKDQLKKGCGEWTKNFELGNVDTKIEWLRGDKNEVHKQLREWQLMSQDISDEFENTRSWSTFLARCTEKLLSSNNRVEVTCNYYKT
ncbi:hypothetical protein [Mycoplasma suis]|uniref:Uncharacterized protein n=1 Tax=Mycoplasma suis (strain Illinois) TaxID=768700 RepID=F0QRJ2_MYCSL|nr:hypothetical protein [Mycoplasma suis]ADX98112.1 hypothetical protein MSU_0580 [Mycoplasma suis str. Illinois]